MARRRSQVAVIRVAHRSMTRSPDFSAVREELFEGEAQRQQLTRARRCGLQQSMTSTSRTQARTGSACCARTVFRSLTAPRWPRNCSPLITVRRLRCRPSRRPRSLNHPVHHKVSCAVACRLGLADLRRDRTFGSAAVGRVLPQAQTPGRAAGLSQIN